MANVLEVPELLEMILLWLPMKDLLFAQKICRRWQAAINGSKQIRKALFFEPGAAVDAPCETKLVEAPILLLNYVNFEWDTSAYYRRGFYLTEASQANPDHADESSNSEASEAKGANNGLVALNPLLYRFYRGVTFGGGPWIEYRPKPAPRANVVPSCERMFITQPLVSSIALHTQPQYGDRDTHSWEGSKFVLPAGLKYGHPITGDATTTGTYHLRRGWREVQGGEQIHVVGRVLSSIGGKLVPRDAEVREEEAKRQRRKDAKAKAGQKSAKKLAEESAKILERMEAVSRRGKKRVTARTR